MRKLTDGNNTIIDPQDLMAGVVYGLISIIASYVYCFFEQYHSAASIGRFFCRMILLLSLRSYLVSLSAATAVYWINRLIILIGIAATLELLVPVYALWVPEHHVARNILFICQLVYVALVFTVVYRFNTALQQLHTTSKLFWMLGRTADLCLAAGIICWIFFNHKVVSETLVNIVSGFMILILYRAYRLGVKA